MRNDSLEFLSAADKALDAAAKASARGDGDGAIRHLLACSAFQGYALSELQCGAGMSGQQAKDFTEPQRAQFVAMRDDILARYVSGITKEEMRVCLLAGIRVLADSLHDNMRAVNEYHARGDIPAALRVCMQMAMAAGGVKWLRSVLVREPGADWHGLDAADEVAKYARNAEKELAHYASEVLDVLIRDGVSPKGAGKVFLNGGRP